MEGGREERKEGGKEGRKEMREGGSSMNACSGLCDCNTDH